jgi:hypothetical protein
VTARAKTGEGKRAGKVAITLRLDKAEWEALDTWTRGRGVSVNDALRHIIAACIREGRADDMRRDREFTIEPGVRA